jgi:hypothetical protein
MVSVLIEVFGHSENGLPEIQIYKRATRVSKAVSRARGLL